MNKPNDREDELMRMASLLDQVIKIHHPTDDVLATDISAKIDFLEHAIEAWRYYTRCDTKQVKFETFVQSSVFVDDGRINFHVPSIIRDVDAGTSAALLQPKLLMFLLLYHRERYAIYDIIEKFTDRIRDELTILDFKKTKTGVVRCFTNTRFAATTLREYGFFRYTRKEAVKTWVLSLPGLLAASKVIQGGDRWKFTSFESRQRRAVHPNILWAAASLKTYDDFVKQLQFVCKPNVNVFDTFEEVLKKSHKLLVEYFDVLDRDGINKADRKAETTKRIKILESLPNIEDFYVEFSKCVNVEQLLKDLDEADAQSDRSDDSGDFEGGVF